MNIIDESISGHLSLSDLVAQGLLSQNTDNVTAWAASVIQAIRVADREKAEQWLEKLKNLDAPDSIVGPLAQEIRLLPPSNVQMGSSEQPRFLLIKSWGYGFWSDIEHVLSGALMAEITGRIPVVHWGANSWYGDDEKKDAFTAFFAPLSDYGIDDLFANSVFPEKWRDQDLRRELFNKYSGPGSRVGLIEFLGRTDILAVSDYYTSVQQVIRWLPKDHPMAEQSVDAVFKYCIAKYLKPHTDIMSQVDAFIADHFGGRRVLAAHIRNADKLRELDKGEELYSTLHSTIEERMAEDPDLLLFLLSDDARAIERYAKAHGSRVVFTSAQRTDNDAALTHTSTAPKKTLGRDVLVDALIAARCDTFIGIGWSSLAASVARLADPAKAEILLIGTDLHTYFNSQVYTMSDPMPAYTRPLEGNKSYPPASRHKPWHQTPPFRAVVIGSIPRTASTVLQYLTTDILAEVYPLCPEIQPEDDDRAMMNLKMAIEDQRYPGVCCLQTHFRLDFPTAAGRIITCERDIREVAASMRRRQNWPLDRVTSAIRSWIGVSDHYWGLPDDRCLKLKYADVINDLEGTARKIRTHLRVTISDTRCDEIATKLDRNKVADQLAQADCRDDRKRFGSQRITSTPGDESWETAFSQKECAIIYALTEEWRSRRNIP